MSLITSVSARCGCNLICKRGLKSDALRLHMQKYTDALAHQFSPYSKLISALDRYGDGAVTDSL